MANVYEGNKPFVFISYSHKDINSVLPIIEALKNRGVRLWYDYEGIEPGASWRRAIISHIDACYCFLCFLSHHYIDSPPCRKELDYSEDEKKPTISICLEDFQLFGELKWQLGSTQSLFYSRFSSADALADRLVNSSLVAACRIDGSEAEKEKIPPAEPVPVQKTGPTVENLLKRAAIAVEDGDWEDAAAFCEQVLNMEPENPQAYLTMLLAQMKVTSVEQLATAAEFSEDNKYYKKLLRFADEETKAALAQALKKAKNKKRPTTPAIMTWEEFVESIEEDEALCDEIDAAEEDSFAQVFTKEEDEKLCVKSEAAEADFKKNATIENGVLKKYNGSEAVVCISDDVIRIEGEAFENCENLTSVTIPNSVITIGARAFLNCKALTSVTIPGSVSHIDANPFLGCDKLTEIAVSARNPNFYVENGHLIDKRTKTLITGCANTPIPTNGSVIGIKANAFSLCSTLTSVTIPDGVTSIGPNAFSGCKSLTSVTIPGSVSYIDANPFGGCSNLTEIVVSAKNPNFYVENGHLIDKRTKTLITGCGALASVTIPGSVTSIGDSAFSSCGALTSVTIPGSVTSIGKRVFSGCSALTSVSIPGSVTSIGDSAFSSCKSLASVTISGGVTSIGDFAFSFCSALTSVSIPGSVTSIGLWAFTKCKSITSVTISGGVTSIGRYAFSGCESLTSVTIPNSVTSIGADAFSGCSALTSVSIPNSVTSIESNTFSGCSALTSVTIPNSVTSIGLWAFSGCSALTSVVIPKSVTQILYNAFEKCGIITIVTPKDSYAWKWAEKKPMFELEAKQGWQARFAANHRKIGH